MTQQLGNAAVTTTSRAGTVIDTDDLTPAQTAAQIVEALDTAR
ncbi:hypothetical protein [Terrabacter aerolatus]|nr:hypothetical protein [Terrabacter aerolatus]